MNSVRENLRAVLKDHLEHFRERIQRVGRGHSRRKVSHVSRHRRQRE